MNQVQTAETVLSELPGWRGATWRELKGGLTNRTLLIERNGNRAVLKIDESPRGAPYNSRAEESQIQQQAFANGLASRVLLAKDTVYMTEFMEGRVWATVDLQDNTNLDNLAAALRKLHSMPLTGRTFDALGAARKYSSLLGNEHRDRICDCLQTIEAGPVSGKLCFCHNDLVADNIISTPEVRFLDWEYACDNDPFFDLATVVAHHKLTTAQSDYLLDAYFDGDGMRWREQLARQASVYEALYWLWKASRLPAVAQLP